ncbi:phage head closure protein [Brevibacillus laterosporus]|uniref:phage head closure protein n=1 Tax=Brevibacillus laterosporus TaxID=1465 RepID=UPI002E20DCD0|nr:phage head closure protein [Brevibacillus laterosporus]MED1786151.1 phage head closure protein [Brevibacillus laterosporus]
MRIGSLRHRITIQERIGLVFQDFAKVWSSIEPISAKEKLERADMEQSITHRIRIRYRKGLTSTMRVIYKDRLFSVESIIDPTERQKELELICEELLPLIDVIKVLRKAPVKDERNIVTMDNPVTCEIKVCITAIEDSFKRFDNEPVEWGKKAKLICDLSEDIKAGDTVTLLSEGDFFVVDANQGKHFLEITAHQDKRGAENGF